MKEKYYDLAYQAARDKAREMLNKLRKMLDNKNLRKKEDCQTFWRRKEKLDKIYNQFETTTDAIVPTDFNYQANYVNSAIE